MNRPASALCIGVLMLLTVGCGGSSTQPNIDEKPSAGAAPSAGAVRYARRQFALPLEVDRPAWLPAEPATDEPNFLTWTGEGASVERTAAPPVVMPRPAVTAPTPGRRVSWAHAPAAHAADCS